MTTGVPRAVLGWRHLVPRRPRIDKPGRLHHVLNRGQDRQEIFRRPGDYRFFLALLACAERAGRIRLHAFCLMPNHFYLLVESVNGDIASTMQWVQGRYAGYFNCTREHVGHVFGGRFHSFPVLTAAYLFTLIRYIDRNPLKTRDPVDPLNFQWCSAYHYARVGPRPRWLSRDLIDRFFTHRPGRGQSREAAYRAAFRIGIPDPAGDDVVETRVAGRSRQPDELDAMLHMRPDDLARWLCRRASREAPITAPLAMVDAGSVLRAVASARDANPAGSLRLRGVTRRDVLSLVEAGLLRDLCGRTYASAGEALGTSGSRVRQRCALHRIALVEDERYLDLASRVAHRRLRKCARSRYSEVSEWV